MEIRRSYDRLISTMGFPILVRWDLYIESGPWVLSAPDWPLVAPMHLAIKDDAVCDLALQSNQGCEHAPITSIWKLQTRECAKDQVCGVKRGKISIGMYSTESLTSVFNLICDNHSMYCFRCWNIVTDQALKVYTMEDGGLWSWLVSLL